MVKDSSEIRPIHRLLIANRGEIAVRIIKTCREHGIYSIAVYSDSDRNALHVQLADTAYYIGNSPPSDSYLNVENIIQAALQTEAQAIHPGYGFLSETPELARRCLEEGILFIGPSEESIRLMGSKAEARSLMSKRGIPVAPGYDGIDQKEKTLIKHALEIGFPVLIKASGGGGGRGLRLVKTENELTDAIQSAKREATLAFGDDRLIIEKYFEAVRHIEFQIFGDSEGSFVHMFERECSVQRRHQKVIEESPSQILDENLRSKMAQTAVKAASVLNYENAGTVEFILATDGSFYFLEINTRLQVEHPVTEMCTGLDLVYWQITIAEGHPLPLRQHEIRSVGHAIECRLYAEDPANAYQPDSGSIALWDFPENEHTRIDTGIATGSQISSYYDPLIAKITCLGEDRTAAIRQMRFVLQSGRCYGVRTNLHLLQNVMSSEAFQTGNYNTALLSAETELVHQKVVSDSKMMPILGGLLLHRFMGNTDASGPLSFLPASWGNNNRSLQVQSFIVCGGQNQEYQLQYRVKRSHKKNSTGALATGSNQLSKLTNPGLHYELDVLIGDNKYSLRLCDLHGRRLRFEWDRQMHTLDVLQTKEDVNEVIYELQTADVGPVSVAAKKRFSFTESAVEKGDLIAPIPAEISAVFVRPGQKVKMGEKLLVFSSMKIENDLICPESGLIDKVLVRLGDQVSKGQLLIKMKEDSAQ